MSVLARALCAALAAALLLGVGCGEDERSPRETVEQLQAAFASGDFERACRLMTPAAARHVGRAAHREPSTCSADLEALAVGFRAKRDARDAPLPKVGRVEVDGDHAVAELGLGASARSEVPLVRHEGVWKVDALYGDIPAGRQTDRF